MIPPDTYQEIFESLPTGLALWEVYPSDEEMRMVAMNHEGVAQLGVEETVVKGRFGECARTAWPSLLGSAFFDAVRDTGETGRVRKLDVPYGEPGERIRMYECQIYRVSAGPPSLVAVAYKDITDTEAREEDLNWIAGTMSHEMSGKLLSIQTWVNYLTERYTGPSADPWDERAQRWKDRILEDTKAGLRLVDDIRVYAREAFRKRGNEYWVDMNKMVKSVAIELDVHSFLEIPVPLPKAVGHPEAVGIVLRNLFSNAKKYAHPDRRLEITVRSRCSECISDTGCRFCHYVVEDNGIGISEKFFPKMFEPMRRGHSRSGTGLGLAICRRIVHWHGGKIWAESVEGEGTAIHFTLPGGRRRVSAKHR